MGLSEDRGSVHETGRNLDIGRHWRWGVAVVWLTLAAILLTINQPDIAALALGDTDDNMRLAQVRALLAGQGWYDLIQYRLAPPVGANIHWSRLADLPIAGLILLLRPLLGTALGEQWAVALAPLLPLAVGLFALALAARRLVDPRVWPLALLVTLSAGAVMPMWMPLRIDHHGWQLALLAVALAGLADPRRRRGGVTSGLASALSLVIGLEMLAFLALIGAATALFWVRDRTEAPRIAGYGASLGGGSALGFLIFASAANRAPVCDALSPVWLSAMVAAGGLLVLLAVLRASDWRVRLGLAAIAGAALGIGFALLWPACLARPEGVSDQLKTLWLDNVREAQPIYAKDWRAALALVALPFSGLAGYAIALGRNWRGERAIHWYAAAALALAGVILLLWQVRLGPAAQLLAIPGATALGWYLLPKLRASRHLLLRVGGTLAALALATGLYAAIPLALFPKPADPERAARQAQAARCATRDALAPIAALPEATFLTPIDFTPRLIVMTPHRAIAGPYHRNGAAMLDVLLAFRGDIARARETVSRYGVGYVLLCPRLSEERLYGDSPASFFARLSAGAPPVWLEPVALPEGSPFRLWKVR